MQYFIIDAFAEKLFTGNPAGVVPLEQWLPDELMQNLAMENNLAETAFFVPAAEGADHDFHIRWFTPALEIDLCGHATLASGFVLFNKMDYQKSKIVFRSKSGLLTVTREGDVLKLDFPSWTPERVQEDRADIKKALGDAEIVGVYKNRDYIIELNNEADVRKCSPDFSLLKKLDRMLMITAPGDEVDFVSRFFAPTAGIDEDPVTGSAHSQLIPFWNDKTGKQKMVAKQLSKRGGTIYCEQNGDRVSIGGTCVFYMRGEFETGNDQ